MRSVVSALTMSLALSVVLEAGPLTSPERQRLLAHLEMTESWLVDELAGLSAEQITFRMAPGTWTIADVVEHLAIAEPQYWEHFQVSLSAPAGEVKPEATDAGILWYGIDRTDRNRTGEARQPSGRFKDSSESLAAFRKLRNTMREYARETQEDLRGRMLKDGNMDVYQWFLMISTHAQRHILQIREIKAHSDWPRAKAKGQG
jgi:hypothetical protein